MKHTYVYNDFDYPHRGGLRCVVANVERIWWSKGEAADGRLEG